MKTKNLMTAFALSAMFAACSQDTELNETLAKNDFSNIPMVEASFTVNTGVDSRMANGFNWELQDKVGFVWLGDDSSIPVDGNAYQNNPLYCIDTDGAFKAEGMFYVGKYFAYMPYTEGNHSIEPINFNVTGQPLTTNNADLAKHTIYISPEVYTLEKEDADGNVTEGNLPSGIGKNLPLNIARVSNFATINLTFDNAENLTDLKIYSVSLSATKNTYRLLPASFTYAPAGSASVTNKAWKGYSEASFYTIAKTVPGEIVANSKDGVAVANNALTVYMLTMPGADTPDNLNIEIATNYGVVSVDTDDTYGDEAEACIAFTEGGKDKTIATTSLFNDFGSAGTINVYVDMDNKVINGSVVKTQTALEEELKMLETAEYDKPVTFVLNPETANKAKNFVLTDFILPEGLKSIVTLTVDSNAENGISFEGTTTVNKQLVISAPSTVKGTMIVENLEDANGNQLMTLDARNITVANEAVLVNNGKLQTYITTVAATTGADAKAAGKYVSNSENAVFAQGGLTNNGEAQWIAGVLPAISGAGAVYAEVMNFEDMLAADKAGVKTVRFVNNVTFDNYNDDVKINNSIKNIEIYSDVYMNVYKKSLGGSAVSVQLGNVVNITVKEGATFNVFSNLESNEIVLGNNCKIVTEKNTDLALNKIIMSYLGSIEYAGYVSINKSKLGSATKIQKEGGVYVEM